LASAENASFFSRLSFVSAGIRLLSADIKL
jgi:hypothetical protein